MAAGIGERLRHANATLTQRFEHGVANTLRIAGLTGAGNLLVGLGKLILGMASLSIFTCVSALYTLCMVLAKACVLASLFNAAEARKQYCWLSRSAAVLLLSSAFYAGYSVRLFFNPSTPTFHIYIAIGIATFTFVELGLNIRGLVIARKNHALPVQALKTISLCAALACLVLTQSSLLALSEAASMETYARATGLFGVIMSVVCALLGTLLLLRIRRNKKAILDRRMKA